MYATLLAQGGIWSGLHLIRIQSVIIGGLMIRFMGRAITHDVVGFNTEVYSNIHIRLADELAHFVNSLSSEERYAFSNGHAATDTTAVSTWAKYFCNDFVVIARDSVSRKIVGVVRTGWDTKRKLADISVAVSPRYRGGVGRLLVVKTLLLLYLLGVCEANAQVSRSNGRSKALFMEMGFVPSKDNDPCEEDVTFRIPLHMQKEQ